MNELPSTGKDAPKVSVVIPAYNRAKYLGMAIQSVLNQTFTDFELIVVDNNSTDGSLEIAQIAAQQDSRIRVITEEQQGASYALRTGFGEALGEYVCQVDSDDLLEAPALEKTVEFLDANPEVGMVYTNYLDIDESGKKLRPGKRCAIPYSKERLLIDFMIFHFRLIRKSVYIKTGGINPNFDRLEDYELCLRLSEITKIIKINDYLYLYRIHPNSLKVTMNDLERIQLCKKAIVQALKRRGMESTHKLHIALNPTFFVEKLNQSKRS
jgi:glycosyltransferase involved in cell wall biosynthesis